MEFPKLPYNFNRNRKIMDFEDAEIKRLAAEGKKISYLAKKFGVHWSTIKKHLDEEYRIKSVKASVKAHKIWYKKLPREQKQKLWRYASQDFKENARRFSPQMAYLNQIVENNHNKPENYKKRMQRQKEYANRPLIKDKILAGARRRYGENLDLIKYHHQYNKDYKATHKLVDGKWIMADNLKWRILREMVIR